MGGGEGHYVGLPQRWVPCGCRVPTPILLHLVGVRSMSMSKPALANQVVVDQLKKLNSAEIDTALGLMGLDEEDGRKVQYPTKKAKT